MKAISFNLNGIRSASQKGFFEWLAAQGADLCFFQELKCQQAELPSALAAPAGFEHAQYHFAQKKGYSGVGLWSKEKPLSFRNGFGVAEFDDEGRYAEAEFENLIAVSCYFPSGSAGDHRHASKLRFLEAFAPHWESLLARGKPILICADVNIAHREIDLKNWKGNLKSPGFTPEERSWMDAFFASGARDVYRGLLPTEEAYTWWSQRGGCRGKNIGWRIDYHLACERLASSARQALIHKAPAFSDHAALEIIYDFDPFAPAPPKA